jgi:hypothetical protein
VRRFSKRPAQTYSFDGIFGPDTPQQSHFQATTIPLIEDALLSGRDGLLFTYGVSNSGKSWSLEGGKPSSSRGIIPRTIDTIFSSIKGHTTEASIGNLKDTYIPPATILAHRDAFGSSDDTGKCKEAKAVPGTPLTR